MSPVKLSYVQQSQYLSSSLSGLGAYNSIKASQFPLKERGQEPQDITAETLLGVVIGTGEQPLLDGGNTNKFGRKEEWLPNMAIVTKPGEEEVILRSWICLEDPISS